MQREVKVNKGGMSFAFLVFLIIFILFVLALIVFVWGKYSSESSVSPVVSGASNVANISMSDIVIESVSKQVRFVLTRGTDANPTKSAANISGVVVTLSGSSGGSVSYAKNVSLDVSESKELIINYSNSSLDDIQNISISQILVISDEDEVAGDVLIDSGEMVSENDSIVQFDRGNLSDLALLAYYPLDENFVDYSGNTGEGRAINGPSFIARESGQALVLNGVNQYITYPSNDLASYGNLSVAARIYPEMSSGDGNIIYHGFGGEFSVTYSVVDGSNGYVSFNTKLKDGRWHWVTAPIESGKWTQVTGLWSRGGKLMLYVNGELINSTDVPNYGLYNPGSIFESRIGAYGFVPVLKDLFKGNVDDVVLYNRELSLDEINLIASSKDYCLGDFCDSGSKVSVNLTDFCYDNDGEFDLIEQSMEKSSVFYYHDACDYDLEVGEEANLIESTGCSFGMAANDYCVNQTTLAEQICSDNSLSESYFDCDIGCEEGACL